MARYDWIKFYPDDWVNDPELATCNLATQGVLIRLMGLMHRSIPYGYLLINGSSPAPADIQRVLGIHHNTYRSALEELLKKGVLKRDEIGVYSARMVRDQQERDEMSRRGKKGGNPALLNLEDKQGVKLKDKLGVKPDIDIDKEIDKDIDNSLTPGNPILTTFSRIANRLEVVKNIDFDQPRYKDTMATFKGWIERLGWDGFVTLAQEAYDAAGEYDKPKTIFQFEFRMEKLQSDRDGRTPIYDTEGEKVVEWWDAAEWKKWCKDIVEREGKWCLRKVTS